MGAHESIESPPAFSRIRLHGSSRLPGFRERNSRSPHGFSDQGTMPPAARSVSTTALGSIGFFLLLLGAGVIVLVIQLDGRTAGSTPTTPAALTNQSAADDCSLNQNERLFAIGGTVGYNPDIYASTVEVFDGTAWAAAPALLERREGFGAAVFNSYIYVVGGYSGGSDKLASVERFDGTAWRSVASIRLPRSMLRAVAFKGRLYALGGWSYSGTVYPNVESYDGTSWREDTRMNHARASFGACVYQDRLYVAGTIRNAGSHDDSVEYYDGSSWTSVQAMNDGGFGFDLVPFQGMLYATTSLKMQVMTPDHMWTEVDKRMLHRHDEGGAALFQCRVLLAGGNDGSGFSDAVERFDGKEWEQDKVMKTARREFALVTFSPS